MASNDRPTVADMVGIWKDAFPEGIDSVEIIRCNRNGWDYDDYIRLRDMGVDPDDLPDGPYLIARYRLNR
jgi:hypothetical protein